MTRHLSAAVSAAYALRRKAVQEQVRLLARLVRGNCVARLPYRPCNNARPKSHQVSLDLHAPSKYGARACAEEQ